MNKKHEKELEQIAKYYNKPIKELQNTYYKKQAQYIRRDMKLGKAVELTYGLEQGERTLKTIETYLNKTLKV